jgi:hypothetical protein
MYRISSVGRAGLSTVSVTAFGLIVVILILIAVNAIQLSLRMLSILMFGLV